MLGNSIRGNSQSFNGSNNANTKRSGNSSVSKSTKRTVISSFSSSDTSKSYSWSGIIINCNTSNKISFTMGILLIPVFIMEILVLVGVEVTVEVVRFAEVVAVLLLLH